MKVRGSSKPPGYFPGRPPGTGETPVVPIKGETPAVRGGIAGATSRSPLQDGTDGDNAHPKLIRHGDPLAAKARKRKNVNHGGRASDPVRRLEDTASAQEE